MSPPMQLNAELGGDLPEAVVELDRELLAGILGEAEDDVGLARFGTHRGQVGERRPPALSARSPPGGTRAREVDSLYQDVDGRGRRGAGLGHGGIVAGADPHPLARGRAARATSFSISSNSPMLDRG